MPSEVWDEITDPFQNFNDGSFGTISFFIPYTLIDVITHPR